MFRITEQRSFGRLVLKLEGRCSAECVGALEQCWRAARSGADAESIWIDLSDVDVVDLAGQEQLSRMHREGARFLTRGVFMRELVREICQSC